MTSEATPLISVVIPTYNRAEHVSDTIRSVLSQRGVDFEVVVVDDGSTDATPAVLARLDDPRVSVVAAQHRGVCDARNAGVEASRGRWVTFIDSDDRAEEGWLLAFASLAADNVGLVSCAAVLEFPDGERRTVSPKPLGPAFGGVTAHFLAGTFAVRREVFRAVGGYRSGLRYGENTELGMRLGHEVVARDLAAASDSRALLTVAAQHRTYDAERYYEASMQALRESGQLFDLDRHLRASYLAIAGVAASRLGRRGEAIRLLGRAWRAEPLNLRHPYRVVRAFAFGGRSDDG